VYLDISQEVSSPGPVTSASGNPPINQRQFQTQVAVQSGQTVLLGGMIQDQESTSKNGAPLISKIPLLSNLFGSTNNSKNRTELIVLITPRVINNSDEARQMTEDYSRQFESLQPLRAKAQSQTPQPSPSPQPPQQPAQTYPVPDHAKSQEEPQHDQ
jgi:general secretion pathway protein D